MNSSFTPPIYTIDNTTHTESDRQAKALVIDCFILFSFAAFFWVTKHIIEWTNLLENARLFSQANVVKFLDLLFWTLTWFGFSVNLVMYNKWLLQSWQGGFDFPLIISASHMIIKYALSYLSICYTTFGSNNAPNVPKQVWWFSAVPIGVATALDVGASNASLMYLSVTFYTVVKSTNLIFTLLFSILYGLQKPSLMLFTSVAIISIGVGLSSSWDSQFNSIGFALVLGSSAIGGFRWSLTNFSCL